MSWRNPSPPASPRRTRTRTRSCAGRAATLAELVENATENRRLLIRTVFEPEIGYVLQAEAEGARPLPDAYVPTSAEIVESVLTVQDHGSMFPGMDDEAPIV